MVVFVDLDQDAFRHPGSLLAPEKLRAATSKAAEFPPSTTSTSTSELKAQVTLQDAHTATTLSKQSPTSKTPNCNAFSAALSCYPYVDFPPQPSPRPFSPHSSQELIRWPCSGLHQNCQRNCPRRRFEYPPRPFANMPPVPRESGTVPAPTRS